MDVATTVRAAVTSGASDLHLEPGQPLGVRRDGKLNLEGPPCSAADTRAWVDALLRENDLEQLREQRAVSVARTVAGVRCRVSVLQSARGLGVAVRLLSSFEPTLEKLNLHPDLSRLIDADHGLVLICGPTGSGKSSTLAALVQEINLSDCRHVVTLERPIEYALRPRRALLRQREVGRDTPSFERGLKDVLREDPDVVLVGEMRSGETMRLTLDAAETGHLVMATMHSGSCIEALQRFAGSMPEDSQEHHRAQLADCLVAVVAQRLVYRADLELRVPELEVLWGTNASRNLVRMAQYHQLQTVMESGIKDGHMTRARYRAWLDSRAHFHGSDEGDRLPADSEGSDPQVLDRIPSAPAESPRQESPAVDPTGSRPRADTDEVIVIEPPAGTLSDLISELGDPPERDR